jgi:lipid-A-disaccharide synthase
LLKGKIKDLQTMVIVAPFTTVADIEKYVRSHIFDVYAPLDSATAADLALTIPGTNTAQLALLGVPEVMIFPLDDPKVIPLEGLLHYLGIVPFLGALIKRAVAYAANKNTKFFALPNIKADRMIIPEFRGRIRPVRVAQLIEELLKDPDRLFEMSRELKVSLGAPGAADHITEVMLNEALSASA